MILAVQLIATLFGENLLLTDDVLGECGGMVSARSEKLAVMTVLAKLVEMVVGLVAVEEHIVDSKTLEESVNDIDLNVNYSGNGHLVTVLVAMAHVYETVQDCDDLNLP
jgi:hypothetical protein